MTHYLISIFYIVIILQVVIFTSFIFAFKYYFKSSTDLSKDTLYLKYVGLAAIISNISVAIFNFKLIYIINTIGNVILVISYVIFIFAYIATKDYNLHIAFDKKDITQKIQTRGIYKYVRHPFYLSYSLSWIGAPLSSGNLLLIAFLIPMFYLYIKAANLEEENILNSSLSDEYSIYRRKTKKIIPFIM